MEMSSHREKSWNKLNNLLNRTFQNNIKRIISTTENPIYVIFEIVIHKTSATLWFVQLKRNRKLLPKKKTTKHQDQNDRKQNGKKKE